MVFTTRELPRVDIDSDPKHLQSEEIDMNPRV
jgi:hypothetical protein